MTFLTSVQIRHLVCWGIATLFLVIFAIIYLDQSAAHLLTEEQAARSYRITRELTDAGESSHFFVIAILCGWGGWAYLKYGKNIPAARAQKIEKIRFWGISFLYSLIAAGICTHIFKFIIGRARPNQSLDRYPWDFDLFTHHWHNHSFPSGHSQTLFTAAVAFGFAFPKYQKVIFLVAALLAFTRILLNQHFLSDVIMGSYIGYAVSLIVFYWRFSSRSSATG